VVEPGEIELWIGTSTHREASGRTVLVGPTWPVTIDARRWTTADVE
jgi:beta-glucosidase